MIKPLRKFSFLLLLLLPFVGYCQLPVPKWVDHFGGSGDSKATGMVVDKQSNVYVGGYFAGTVDFDPSAAGVKNLTSKGGYDIYMAKYKPDGTLIWAESFGGGLLDQVNSLGIDANGNPTLIGQFQSSDLLVGATTLQTAGADDIFIIHLNTNGGVLWAKSIGGQNTDRGEQVNADAQGNIIATAIFQSTITVGGNTLTAGGGFHGLIVKYGALGNLIWDINLGSSSGDTEVFGNGIDSNGNILISGSYTGQVDFDPRGAHKNSTSNGANMPFLAKYTPAGKLIWINYLGGNLVSNQTELSVDANNDIVLTGSFSSNLTFNGTTTLTAAGQDDFVAKYTANGSFIFAKDLKTTSAGIFNYQVKTDGVNNIYIAGYFSGTVDFDPSAATATVSDHGSRDFYLAKYDKNGNYVWGFSGGAACGSNLGTELAVFSNDDVLLAGSFCSTVDFAPSTCATDNITAINGTSDSFLAHYVAGAAAGQITGFTLPQQTAPAIINQANFTITISVSPGTNLTALVPTITSSDNGTLSPASGVAHDFTNPVVYTLDPGCNQKVYTVTVLSVNQVFICPGSSAKLIGHTPTPAGTFAWQVLKAGTWVNAPGVINGKDYQTAVLANNTASPITYSFRRRVTSGVVTYDSFNDVIVQPATIITNNTIAASGSTMFCAGGSPGIIKGSAPAGGTGTFTYQWQTSADNANFTDITGAKARDWTPGIINATTYYRRKVTSGTCTTPTTSNVVKITITPALKGNTIASPLTTTFCSSVDPAVITGGSPTGGNGSGTYLYQWQQSTNNGTTWKNIPGATSINYNPPLITVTTAFRRNVTSGICTLPVPSNTVTFIILSPPANVKVSAPSICAGNKATLTVTSPNNTLTYIWYDSPGKTKVIFTGPVFTTPVLQSNQSYYVEANNGGCSSPALTKVPVTVNSLPTAPLFQKNPVTVCKGSQATVSIASPNAGVTYTWYTTATGGNAVFTGTVFTTPAITNATTYYVEAANSTGCVSPTRSKADIVASPLPQVTVRGANVCPGSPATLVSNNADPGVTVKWYTAQTGGNSIFTGNSFTTPPVNANTTYYAEAISNTCVSATRANALVQIILPLAAPVVQVLSEKAPDVVFQWGAIAGATGYQVSTDNGLTFTAPSSGANGTTHTVTGLSAGQTISIIVRATGPSECQQSNNSAVATATATSPLTDEIYIANDFTPNGDGKNDVVYVHSENIKSLKFYIYSQWGELLFTSLNQQNGWDGTYKGQKEPVGVYVYYFEAIMNDGQQVNKKGTVTLLR